MCPALQLVVLAVNTGEPKRVLLSDTNLAALFRGPGLPHYAVIDREGKVAKEQSGAGGMRALYQLLAAAGMESEK